MNRLDTFFAAYVTLAIERSRKTLEYFRLPANEKSLAQVYLYLRLDMECLYGRPDCVEIYNETAGNVIVWREGYTIAGVLHPFWCANCGDLRWAVTWRRPATDRWAISILAQTDIVEPADADQILEWKEYYADAE